MFKHKFSFRLSGAGPQDPKYFDAMKIATTSDGSLIVTPLPNLLGTSGLHLSFHPSGVKHVRTTNPKQNADIVGLEDAFAKPENFKALINLVAKPPSQGYAALILMAKNPRNFLTVPVSGSTVVDLLGSICLDYYCLC